MPNSVRYAQQLADKTDALYANGTVHYLWDTYTFPVAAGATATTIYYAKLPAGKVVILPFLSKLQATQGVASADLHLGYAAYVSGATGLTVVADDNFWMDNVDIGAAAIDTNWTAVSGTTAAGLQPAEFNTREGLQLTVMIDTANMDINDVITLQVAYVTNQ